ncbi:hypothetical protein [Streptomyces sp. B6B3]|uniref:hypothetical protein n=1 Tax=Streptomyces sp. B6B3 TaxID=3153570 RepID=UPI00325D0422
MRTPKSTVTRGAGRICGLAVAAALAMTACSDESEEPTDTTSETGESQRADESEEAGDEPADDAAQDEQTTGQATGQATAGEAVATWVTAIIEDQPVDACLAMGTPGADGAHVANTREMCQGDSPEAVEAREGVSSLRESFTPENPGNPPVVEAAGGAESGGTATFDGEQVTVDGQPLTDVVVSNSTGVEPGQIGIGIDATEIDDRWYVTDMNMSFG